MCNGFLTIEMLEMHFERLSQDANVVLSRREWDELLAPELLQHFRMSLVHCLKQVLNIKWQEAALKKQVDHIVLHLLLDYFST